MTDCNEPFQDLSFLMRNHRLKQSLPSKDGGFGGDWKTRFPRGGRGHRTDTGNFRFCSELLSGRG